MIACAIVAILAAIAYPSYLSSVQKSRRSEATASLLGVAAQMERYSTEKGTYATATLGSASPAIYPTHTENSYYNLSLVEPVLDDVYGQRCPCGDTGERSVRNVHLHRIGCEERQRRHVDHIAVLGALARAPLTPPDLPRHLRRKFPAAL